MRMRSWRSMMAGLVLAACTMPNPYLGEEGTTGGNLVEVPQSSTGVTDWGAASSSESVGLPASSSSSTEVGGGTSSGAEAAETGSSVGGSTSETGGPSCPADHACVPEPTPSWSGPVAVWRGALSDSLPECATPYPTLEAAVKRTLVGTEHSCSCECEPQNVRCGSANLRRYNSSNTCGGNASVDLVTETCRSLTSTDDVQSWRVMAPIASGSCAPTPLHEFPIPSFGELAGVCGGVASRSGCEPTQLCVPRPSDPYDPGFCILREGDHACPEEYPEKELWFAASLDNRSCTPCECGPLQGTCRGSVNLFSSITPTGDCTGSVIGTVSATTESCTADPGDVRGARWMPAGNDAACEPAGGEPTGAVEPVGPHTLCCLAPIE